MEVRNKHIAAAQERAGISTHFIVICSLVFVMSITATIYFCLSMCCNMKMPGGWVMSMMWMPMGKTWMQSLLRFLIMWLFMMIAMMMPSALPMFLKLKKQWRFLCYTASGYFFVWMLAGIPVYVLGIPLADAAMQSASLSRAVPLLFGITLMVAGLYQLSNIKMINLLHCRSPFGCQVSALAHKNGFQLGFKQGVSCCICCAALMTVQLILGIMNPIVMIVVAMAIFAEKILPHPNVTAKLFGVAAIVAGIVGIYTR